jgi:hypothetical protein
MIPYLRSDALMIDEARFNNRDLIDVRVAAADQAHRGALRTALRYLYLDDGPVNLPSKRLLASQGYLDPAEKLVIRFLFYRTNGRLRADYGADSLRAARASRYRCQECGFPDVRTLTLDHVEGRIMGTPFACLCWNCHSIKSRRYDWTGKKREPPA